MALIRSHQPLGCFASQREDGEARAIVQLLRDFTPAAETVATYLGCDTAPDDLDLTKPLVVQTMPA